MVEIAESGELEEALYRQDGDLFHPSDLTEGPWRPDAQHGGPPSGLLTLLCEQSLEPVETLARMHINLLTGIPLEPLGSETTRRQVSRRVAHITATLFHGDRPVAEASALALTGGDVPAPDWTPPEPTARSWSELEPTAVPHWSTDQASRPYHRHGLEHRFLEGRFDQAGPASDWVRLRAPVVEGLAVSGYQRAMAAVDVGSGISAAFDPAKGFGMINADLNVAFIAEPVGDWLRLEASTEVGEAGTGVGMTRIYDQQRLVAVATQCLLGTSFTAG